jgi:hypothetical protein
MEKMRGKFDVYRDGDIFPAHYYLRAVVVKEG